MRGTVTDVSQAAIAGAVVKIATSGSTAGNSVTTTTDDGGRFLLANLPPGSYRIEVTSSGFHRFSTELDVFVDDTRLLNVSLVPATPTYTPDIREIRSADQSPEIRTSIRGSMLSALPAGTTFGSVVKFLPFARPEPLISGFQLDGSSGGDNTYFIDGQEVTNYRTGLLGSNFDLPIAQIAEVQVRTTGRDAAYSGAVGGTLNIVTRGGGNALRGEFGISLTPAGLRGGSNPFLSRFGTGPGEIEYFTPRKDRGTWYFPSASLSGPIIKDRFWFFASYAPQIVRVKQSIDYFSSSNPGSRTVTESIDYEATLRAEQAFLRLDARPMNRLRLFASYIYNPIVQDGAIPQLSEGLGGIPQSALGLRGADYLATRGGRVNSQFVTGQATFDATRRFRIKVRGGYGFLNEKLDSYGIPKITRFVCSTGTTPPVTAGCSAGFQNVASNSFKDFDASKRTTFGVEGDVSGIDLFGRHRIRFGYDYNRLFHEIRNGFADTGLVLLFYGRSIDQISGLPLTPTPGNLGSGILQRSSVVGSASGENRALFVQDSWTLGRLGLDFGLRFEKENLPNYGDPVYLINGYLAGEEFDFKWGWKDKIAPRIAGAFDFLGDGRIRVFAGYGLYYDRAKYNGIANLYARFLRNDYFEILPSRGASYSNYSFRNILGTGPATNQQCPISASDGWSVCRVGPPFSSGIPELPAIGPNILEGTLPARIREFNAGFEHRLSRSTTIAGRYIFRDLDRVIDDVTFFLPTLISLTTITNPGALTCASATETNYPCQKPQRRYDAVEVLVDRRAGNYFLNASYTYSRLVGNYSGLSNSDEGGRTAPNVGRNFDQPSSGFTADGAPDNGRLGTDRPHVFKAYGGYSFRWTGQNETTVSAFTTVQSGTPLTTVYSLYGIANSILFSRGNLGRTETFSETDLRLGHTYRFGNDGRFSIEPYVVFLNLFDERNELTRQTLISSTNFSASTLATGGCSGCTAQASVYNVLFGGGGISRYVTGYLAGAGVSSAGRRNDYNLPNSFQAPRSIRFGFRFAF